MRTLLSKDGIYFRWVITWKVIISPPKKSLQIHPRSLFAGSRPYQDGQIQYKTVLLLNNLKVKNLGWIYILMLESVWWSFVNYVRYWIFHKTYKLTFILVNRIQKIVYGWLSEQCEA